MKREWECIKSSYTRSANMTEIQFMKRVNGRFAGSMKIAVYGNKRKKFRVGELYAIGYKGDRK